MEVMFGGIVTEVNERTTKFGKRMMIVKLEDFDASTEVLMFEEQMREFGHQMVVGNPVMVKGIYKKGKFNDELRFNLLSVNPLDRFRGALVNSLTLVLTVDQCTTNATSAILEQIQQGEGQRVALSFAIDTGIPGRPHKLSLGSGNHIKINRKFLKNSTSCKFRSPSGMTKTWLL